jgi:hypothetical protein
MSKTWTSHNHFQLGVVGWLTPTRGFIIIPIRCYSISILAIGRIQRPGRLQMSPSFVRPIFWAPSFCPWHPMAIYIYIFTYIYIYIYDKMYNVHLALGLALTEVLETWSPQRSSTPCASQRVWWRPTDQRTVTGWWRNDLRLGGPKEWGDVFLYDFCRFMFVYSKDHMIWYDMN